MAVISGQLPSQMVPNKRINTQTKHKGKTLGRQNLRHCKKCVSWHNYWDYMFFVGQSNNSINFLLGWIKYTVNVINPLLHTHTPPSKLQGVVGGGGWWWLDQPRAGRSCRSHLPTIHWSHGTGGGGGCCYIVHLYGASYVTISRMLHPTSIIMVSLMSQSLHSLLQ